MWPIALLILHRGLVSRSLVTHYVATQLGNGQQHPYWLVSYNASLGRFLNIDDKEDSFLLYLVVTVVLASTTIL